MEKKTKKLQLRKETIAVLNGEKMTKVVGGHGDPCGETEVYGVSGPAGGPLVQGCFCKDGYGFDGSKCVPFELLSKLAGKYDSVCDIIGFSVDYCPTMQPTYKTGIVQCPTGVWCK